MKKVVYINLDASIERRLRIELLLAEKGLTNFSQRFTGVVAKKKLAGLSLSETGCLLSHLSVITSLNKFETTIIIEDDVCFSDSFKDDINRVMPIFENKELDILFLGQTVLYNDIPTHALLIKLKKKLVETSKYSLLDTTAFYRFGSFAYAVNGKSVEKIKKLIEELNLENATQPLDIIMKGWFKSGKLKGAILMPYLIGVDPDISTTMHDRSNAIEHQLHCDCINLYLKNNRMKESSQWENILSKTQNHDALELCEIIYRRLIG